MKSLNLIIILLLSALSLFSQEETSIKVLENPKDSTFRFCEITTKDGDTVNIRFFPQAGLKRNEFKQYAYQLAQQEDERRKELNRIKNSVQQNISFLAATVDSIGGAGSYTDMQSGDLKTKLQGAWSILIRNESNEEPEVLTVVIQDKTMTTKDKQGEIKYDDSENFTLKKGIFDANLKFTQKKPGRWVAEDKKVKYILKR